MTVKEWATHWMERCVKPTVRPTTYAAHNYILQNHIISGLGELALEELSVEDIGRFLDDRKRSGSHRPESANYPGLNDETMRHIHSLLRRCLAQAVAEGRLAENPADAFRYAMPSTVKANVLTATEIEDYLDAAQRLGYLPMFTLELTAGLREGELIALKWSDVDTHHGTITVYEQRAVVRRELVQYGDRQRSIRLPHRTVELLEQEHVKHPSSPYLFPHPGTLRPHSPNMVRLLHKRVIEAAGLDHVRFADLRHIFATLSLQNGMDVKTLSAMLGHVSAATTLDIYTHITDDMRHSAAVNIDRGIGKAELAQGDAGTTPARQEAPRMTDFKPYVGRKRKPGTGCVSQINDHLFEGRYSPMWPDGKKHARNVYAKTREECEEKLKVLIAEMKKEIAEVKANAE